jgi:GNAT superfamily N-acetyltransferase
MATFYLPVGTAEMQAMVAKLNRGRTGKGKAGYTVIACTDSGLVKATRRRFGGGLLRNIAANEKLYVLLHGVWGAEHDDDGSTFMGAGARRGARPVVENGLTSWQGGRMRLYTAAGLAAHLRAEGLTRQFVDLRLWICCSGAAMQALGGISLAEAVRDEMRGRGYAAILVTGYLAELGDSYNHVGWEANNRGILPAAAARHLTADPRKNITGTGGEMVASLHKVQV